LSGEDFYRALRPDDRALRPDHHGRQVDQRAPRLVRWLQSALDPTTTHPLPLLASNAFIKVTNDNLNTVEQGAYELEVEEDESVDWVSELKLAHPCESTSHVRTASNYVIEGEAGASLHRVQVTIDAKKNNADDNDDVCHTTLTLSEPMRPGHKYKIMVSAIDVTFTLRTHRALTPAASGLPVVVAKTADGLEIIVTALVDPSIRNELPARFWQWDNDGDADCPGKCSVDFFGPADTLERLRPLLKARGLDQRLHALMSGLDDAASLSLLDEYPEARVVVLDPDSAMLTRVAAAEPGVDGKDDRYSGDLGSSALVDQYHPALTRFLLRPEWIGEVALVGHAAVEKVTMPGKKGQTSRSDWMLKAPGVCQALIRGGKLMKSVSNSTVTYSVEPPPNSVIGRVNLPASYERYETLDPALPFDDKCEAQRDLWTDPTQFVSLILDTMRRSASAELALVARSVVDDDVVSWLKNESATQRIDWLSKLLLDRVLYHSARFVRVVIAGDELRSTVDKILNDDAYCVAGFGKLICGASKLDEHVRANERNIRPSQFYGLAVPTSVAQEHGLKFEDDQTLDLIDELDSRLRRRCGKGAESTTVSLADRLEKRIARRKQGYLRLDPLSFEYSRVSVEEPPGREGLFKQLPVDANSANESRKWILGANLDFAFIDSRRFAGRAVTELKVDVTRVADQRSISDDEFLVGVRGDWKRPLWRQNGRLFAGVFWDGQTLVKPDTLTPTRRILNIDDPGRPGRVLETVTVTGPPVTFNVPPPRFVYFGVGAETDEWKPGDWLTVTNTRLAFHEGSAGNVPVGVLLGDTTYEVEDIIESGAQGLLNDAFADNPDAITSDTVYRYELAQKRQRRGQFDGNTEHKILWWTDQVTVTTATRFRYYWIQDRPDLTPVWSLKLNLGLKVPIFRRWQLAPYVEWQTVSVEGVSGGNFNYYKYGVKTEWTTFAKWGRGRFWR